MTDEHAQPEPAGGLVPRETPPVPVAAAGVFASRLPQAELFAQLLATDGVERGLLGPREVPRLWERHLLNCVAVSQLIPHGASVVDLGSGAGLPGIVLAVQRPDLSLTLVEPMQRRTQFLHEAVATLDLDNVAIVRGRAEELGGRLAADVVTSRALAPLRRLVEWSLPLTAPDGVILAIKGRSAGEEVAALPLSEQGRAAFEVRELRVGGVESEPSEILLPTTVVRVESAALRGIAWDRSGDDGRRRRPGSSQSRRR